MGNQSCSVIYTTGVFDLFHIGHLNMLQLAKGLGSTLIVGVSTDELVETYKNKSPYIPFKERQAIVSAIKYVDICIPQTERDKLSAWERIGFDTWVVGDDWYGDPYYMDQREHLANRGVKTIFLPYTKGISSTVRSETISK